ncbi:MAG TPA: hypothetical protein ENN84_06535 [Candidatus Marinimicrobia bacterium]|nr:hypothetical protein [Candidatus Neomarinimicrobiota bacterium]
MDTQWRAGAKIDIARDVSSSTVSDTSTWQKMFLGSSALYLEYALRADKRTRIVGNIAAGILFLQFETQVVWGNPAWSAVFEYPGNAHGMNSINTKAAFFFQPSIGLESLFTEQLIFRISAGLLVSEIEKSAWQLNQSLPLADGADISLNQVFFQITIGMCR